MIKPRIDKTAQCPHCAVLVIGGLMVEIKERTDLKTIIGFFCTNCKAWLKEKIYDNSFLLALKPKKKSKVKVSKSDSIKIMPFGKHKGKEIKWIVDNQRGYADWLVVNVNGPIVSDFRILMGA